MGQPAVYFEILGRDGEKLQKYYSELFDWEIDATTRSATGSCSESRI